ncbi:MAG: TIR domain-containing protein [Candidatus Pacebacteria bacterium]|nr:TIR domain-containing protein [Candidatus Paceibacterota bacterium]
MANKKSIFVSFDYEKDKHYKYLLEAWDANDDFDFVFSDKTPTEIDSENIGPIKAALRKKIREATHTLVIVGKEANKQHEDHELIGYRNWINFEVAKSIEDGKRLALVRLEKSYTLPEEVFEGEYSLVEGYTEANIIYALEQAPKN